MKKTTAQAQAQAQQAQAQAAKNAPAGKENNMKQNKTTAQSKTTGKKQDGKKQDSKTTAQGKKQDGKTVVVVPKISSALIAATATDGEREGFVLKLNEKKTAFTRVSIPGQELVNRVQLALACECKAAIDGLLAECEAKKTDDKADEAARALARLQAADLRTAKKKLAARFPGLAKYEREAADNRHARLLAYVLGGYALPVDLDKWETAAAAVFAAFRGTLQAKLDGKGAVSFTDGERQNVTLLKNATEEAFAKYAEATSISRAFILRVKDVDILNWYEMSKKGYGGEGKGYAPLSRIGNKRKNGYRAILTSFFMSCIMRDAEEAPKAAEIK